VGLRMGLVREQVLKPALVQELQPVRHLSFVLEPGQDPPPV